MCGGRENGKLNHYADRQSPTDKTDEVEEKKEKRNILRFCRRSGESVCEESECERERVC